MVNPVDSANSPMPGFDADNGLFATRRAYERQGLRTLSITLNSVERASSVNSVTLPHRQIITFCLGLGLEIKFRQTYVVVP
jgi:hypothetical protein